MKRFKTRRELLKTTGVGPGFGLNNRRLGEPATKHDEHEYVEKIFTSLSHPYEGKSFKIRVTPEESEKVQEKAFKLGYVWLSGENKPSYIGDANPDHYFFTEDKVICRSGGDIHYWDDSKDIALTPQQFLDGDLPDRYGKITHEFSCYDLSDTPPFIKPDAYIRKAVLRYWDDYTDKECQVMNIGDAYMYSLMSEEEFKKRHPDKLEFQEWDVTFDVVDGEEMIKVGCETFTRHELKAFYYVGYRILKHTKLYDAHAFLTNNKKKLGL